MSYYWYCPKCSYGVSTNSINIPNLVDKHYDETGHIMIDEQDEET